MATNPTPEAARRAGELSDKLDEARLQEFNAESLFQDKRGQSEALERELEQACIALGVPYKKRALHQKKVPEAVETELPSLETETETETGVEGGIEGDKNNDSHSVKPVSKKKFFIATGAAVLALSTVCLFSFLLAKKIDNSEIFAEKAVALHIDSIREIKNVSGQVAMLDQKVKGISETTLRVEKNTNELLELSKVAEDEDGDEEYL